ncbi:amino acid adenylation domain-containing protein [Amycolatopsis coloradensis]|uniref:Amino acid adenylation domain-containing protein n=1 Tax=Amycolatopsis coloradensis TaxID=76021 RepID=A0ACD5BHP4_9PSEU
MLSHSQEQLWFLHRMEPSAAYTVPIAYDVIGALDVEVLREALGTLVERHEILRTEYVDVDGIPTARVRPPTPLACPLVELTSGEPELREALRAECFRPLDLGGPHRLRVTLYRLSAGHHVLLLMFHHIVADGWSVQLMVEEIGRHYRAGGKDTSAIEPPQFADHVRTERASGSEEAIGEHLAYWQKRLAGLEDVELPADRPRPITAGAHHGELLRRELRPGLMADVEDLAVREQVSPFMVILAAFAWTLSRTTGSTDIPIGVPTSSRASAESFDTVGLFVNMLAVRNRIDETLPFAEFLRQTRDALLADLGHREVPFSQVVEVVGPPRHRGANPLFQTALGFERGTPDQILAPGVVLRPRDSREIATGQVKFDLDIQVSAAGDGSLLYVEYSSDLFDRWRIEQLLDHFEHVVTMAVAKPRSPLREITLTDPATRKELIKSLTGPERPVPTVDLHDSFAHWVHVAPSRIAAECPDGTFTYAELDIRANTVAEKLRHAGVEPGDRVAVKADRGVALLAAVLGVLKTGAAYLPVDPEAPRQRVDKQFADSGVRVMVDGTEVRAVGAGDIRSPSGEDRRRPAYVLYTSGSTGRPKGVLVSHEAAADFVRQYGDCFDIGEGTRVLQFSNLTFDVSVLEIFTALCRGGTVCMPSLEVIRAPDDLSDYLQNARIDVAVLPPTFVDLVPLRPDLPLRLLDIGGEAFPAELAARWAAPGREVVVSYGPTEATVIMAWHRCGPDEVDPLPFGRPRANSHAYVVDAFGDLAPVGVPGELWIGGVSVAEGYENAPEATREAFVPDPFVPGRGTVYRTGDRCVLGRDGELTFRGRLDSQVKIRGFRVELGEVETVLAGHPDVQQVVVHLVGSGADARVAAWVVPAPGGSCDPARLRQWLGESLPHYMVPSSVDVIDAIPLTPHGKVDRSALPSPGASAGSPMAQPRTTAERHVAEAFAATLGIEQVGIHDGFFELGGTSLRIVRLLAELRRRLGISLPVGDVYAASTVAALADRVAVAPQQALPAQISALTSSARLDREAAPVFLIHPSSGSALCYAPLAQKAGSRFQCWGIGAEERPGGPLPTSVTSMADQYADLIIRFCADRPVYIAGWSFGGIIAQAVAHRLRQRQQNEIAGLVLVDAVLPDGSLPDEKRLASDFRAEIALTLDNRDVSESPELRHRRRLYSAIVRAVHRHRPAPVDVRTLLVSASETVAPTRKWTEFLTGAVIEETLSSDHFGLVTGPAVGRLTALMTDFVTESR